MQSYIEVDEEDLYTLKVNCKGEKNSKKGKQGDKCRKNNKRFKKFKQEKRKKKKGILHRTSKAQHRGRSL